MIAASLIYFAAAAACLVLAGGASRGPVPRPIAKQVLAWRIIGLLLILFGILRPFEVHSHFSEMLRQSAVTGGWYAERTDRQLDLFLLGGFSGAIIVAFLLFETRRWHVSTRIGVLALFYLFGLLVTNIVTLHALDALLGRRIAGVPLRWALDLAGIAALLAAAFRFRFLRTGATAETRRR